MHLMHSRLALGSRHVILHDWFILRLPKEVFTLFVLLDHDQFGCSGDRSHVHGSQVRHITHLDSRVGTVLLAGRHAYLRYMLWLKFTTSFNNIELLNCPPLKINSNPAVWNKALVAISRSASWTRALPTEATLPLQSQEKAPFSPFLPSFASLGQNKPRTGGETTRGARFFHRVVKY